MIPRVTSQSEAPTARPVAQICNLLHRRIAFGQALDKTKRTNASTRCRFQICGTAECNSALPVDRPFRARIIAGVIPRAMPWAVIGRAFGPAEVTNHNTLTAEAQRAIDLLQERRTVLISAAITGQIDVRDAA